MCLLFSLIHWFLQNEVRKHLMVVGYAKRYFEKCFIEKLRKVSNFQNIVFFTVQNLKFSNISEVKAEKWFWCDDWTTMVVLCNIMVDWNLTLGVQTIYIKLLSYIPFHFRYLRKQMTSVLIRIVKQKMLRLKQDGVNIHQIPNQVILWNMYGTRSYAITMWRRVYFTR